MNDKACLLHKKLDLFVIDFDIETNGYAKVYLSSDVFGMFKNKWWNQYSCENLRSKDWENNLSKIKDYKNKIIFYVHETPCFRQLYGKDQLNIEDFVVVPLNINVKRTVKNISRASI